MDRTKLILAGLFIAATMTGWLCFDERLYPIGDNAEFVVLARSILQGEGLSYINGPVPVPSSKYPPGFPLILTIPELISPGNLNLMKSVSIFFFALVVPLTWTLVCKVDSEEMAWLVTGCVLASTQLLSFSHMILSEMPFTAFSLAALLILIKAEDLTDDRRAAALIGLAIVLSYYIRSIGIALIAGAIASQFLSGRHKRGLLLIGATVVLVLPWMLSSGDYFDQLIHVNPYQSEQGLAVSTDGLLDRLSVNGSTYGFSHVPNTLTPTLGFAQDSGWHLKIIAILLDLLIVYFVVSRLRWGRQSVIGIYLGAYLGVVLLWPAVWSDIRFIVPAIPLLFYAVLRATKELLASAHQEKTGRWACVGLGVLMFSLNASASRLQFTENAPYSDAWQHYYDAAAWARLNTRPDAIIACRKPFLMHVATGRTTVYYPWEQPREILAFFEQQGVDFVVLDRVFKSSNDFLTPAITEYRKNFLAVQVYDRSNTIVFEFFPDSSEGPDGSIETKIAALRRALKYSPSNNTLWEQLYSVGTMLQLRGRLSRALEVYEEVSHAMKDDSILFHNLGAIYFTQGQYEKSVEAFTKAVAMSPGLANGHLALAQAYEKLGKDAEAMAEVRKSIGLDATTEAFHVLGRGELRIGTAEGAETAFRKALEIDANDSRSLNGLAYALMEKGDFEEAAKILDSLVRRSKSPEFRADLVNALLHLDRTEEAGLHFRVLVDRHADVTLHGELSQVTQGLADRLAAQLEVKVESLLVPVVN